MSNGGTANYSATHCQEMHPPWQTGSDRNATAGIDDHESTSHPCRGYRRGERGFRTSRRSHAKRGTPARRLSGGMGGGSEWLGHAHRAQWGGGLCQGALLENVRQKTVASAVALANSLEDSKLIVFTLYGRMARYASNLRPHRAPIFAFTPNEQVYRQLALYWGTFPIGINFTGDPDATIASAEKFLRAKKLAVPGNRMVIVS